jgi:PncC family amidohydrolase
MSSYKKIVNKLIDQFITISIAESFTGGEISRKFISVPGVSQIFNMGLITYSNQAKHLILKIPLFSIKKYGAVSEEIAFLMSKNLSKISKSDICISTTGIAGPNGGTKNKPVGLCYISIKFYKKNYTFKKIFNGSREKIQKDAVNFCFNELKKLI